MHVLHTDRHRNMSGPGNSEPCFNHSSLLCDARSSSSSFVCVCGGGRRSSTEDGGMKMEQKYSELTVFIFYIMNCFLT
jgi:hypothetical protein